MEIFVVDKPVGTRPAGQNIAPFTAGYFVRAATSEQGVIARPTVDLVRATVSE